MALRLFEYNEKAYRAAVAMMDEDGKDASIYPTGTGKSYNHNIAVDLNNCRIADKIAFGEVIARGILPVPK